MSTGAWELIFMMLVLKIPIIYLIGVVVWAVRAEPDPFEPSALVPSTPEPGPDGPPAPCAWRAHARRRPRVPHGPRSRVMVAGAER